MTDDLKAENKPRRNKARPPISLAAMDLKLALPFLNAKGENLGLEADRLLKILDPRHVEDLPRNSEHLQKALEEIRGEIRRAIWLFTAPPDEVSEAELAKTAEWLEEQRNKLLCYRRCRVIERHAPGVSMENDIAGYTIALLPARTVVSDSARMRGYLVSLFLSLFTTGVGRLYVGVCPGCDKVFWKKTTGQWACSNRCRARIGMARTRNT